MAEKRIAYPDRTCCYHLMTRTVNGEHLFRDREKEVLRKMIAKVADFSGVEVLTYCLMPNHFHVLVRVPFVESVPDAELVRRFAVLFPEPTRYQMLTVEALQKILAAGGAEAEAQREALLRRMGDVSEFMKNLKQRFSIWFNKTHDRFGTLWAERFKSVLVQGEGNPLQTMAAYIDLNPVRKGYVEDPKDYRFCGYAEAVAGSKEARRGLLTIWGDWIGAKRPAQDSAERADRPSEKSIATGSAAATSPKEAVASIEAFADGSGVSSVDRTEAELMELALQAHRRLIFGKGANPWTRSGQVISRERAAQVLEKEDGRLPASAFLRCRVRYFSYGAILGAAEFVRAHAADWQKKKERKRPPTPHSIVTEDGVDLVFVKGVWARRFD